MAEELKCIKLKPIYWQAMKAILAYHKEHQISPSVRDLQAILGLTSTSLVARRLRMLRRLGAIHYEPYVARTITITCDMIELDFDWDNLPPPSY